MTDRISKKHRSWNMSRIRGRDTTPERIVRSHLHRKGLRFRIHRRDLPGTPDIVLPKYRLVIFVHGCFWHRHKGCKFSYSPKTRVRFWQEKFRDNVDRDASILRQLKQLGWRMVVIWECETREAPELSRKIEGLFPTLPPPKGKVRAASQRRTKSTRGLSGLVARHAEVEPTPSRSPRS